MTRSAPRNDARPTRGLAWTIIATSMLLCFSDAAVAMADEIAIHAIRFDRGKSSAVVSGAVIRGDRDLYSVDARARQTMSLRLTSEERNAAVQVYAPGARPARQDYGIDVVGRELATIPTRDQTIAWQSRLSRSGRYLIVVGPVRGNATYSLTVSVR